MKHLKKALFIVFIAISFCSVLPISAQAEEETQEETRYVDNDKAKSNGTQCIKQVRTRVMVDGEPGEWSDWKDEEPKKTKSLSQFSAMKFKPKVTTTQTGEAPEQTTEGECVIEKVEACDQPEPECSLELVSATVEVEEPGGK